jgi:hypothetical protein
MIVTNGTVHTVGLYANPSVEQSIIETALWRLRHKLTLQDIDDLQRKYGQTLAGNAPDKTSREHLNE